MELLLVGVPLGAKPLLVEVELLGVGVKKVLQKFLALGVGMYQEPLPQAQSL